MQLRWLFLPIIIMAILAVGSALSACTDSYNRHADQVFTRAEAMMDEHPDSALALLDSLDPVQLSGNRRRALYALLLTQARDKNYIDETSDSLISLAVNYFDVSHDLYHRMLSHYYLARVYYYAGNYVDAAREAEAALTTLPENHEKTLYWKGRIFFDLAKLAYLTSDHNKGCQYGFIATDIFDTINEMNWKIETQFITIRCMMALKKWDESSQLLKSIDSHALPYNIYPEFLFLKLTYLMHDEKWDEAEKLYTTVIQHDPFYDWSCEDDARLGYIYACLGDYNNSEKHLALASDKATCHNDTLNVYYYTAFSHLIKNQDINGLNDINNFLNNAYIETTNRINNHLAVGTAAYHKFRAENEALKSRLYSSYLLLSIAIFIIAGGIVYLLVLRYKKQKEKEVDVLTKTNKNLEHTIYDMKAKESSTNKFHSETVGAIKSAFYTGFRKINQLSKKKFATERELASNKKDDSVSSQVPSDSENTFLNDFSKIIAELNSPVLFETLEISLNNTEGNIMQKFRQDYPKMSEQELKLATLIFSEIGSHTICLILNLPNIEALRNRKTRLKKNIERSESHYKDIYLKKF